jgi:hypothetical protein
LTVTDDWDGDGGPAWSYPSGGHEWSDIDPDDDAEALLIDAIFEGGHGFRFETLPELTRAEERRNRNRNDVNWALGTEGRREWGLVIWTPAQQDAVWLFYELGFRAARCARVCGITRQAFDARLSGAERQAKKWYDRAPDQHPRVREKKGRPGHDPHRLDPLRDAVRRRPRGHDPLRPDWMHDCAFPLIRRQRLWERVAPTLASRVTGT